jgi:hypothetical protein
MKKCPVCGRYSVDYNSYKGVDACSVDGCSCIVISASTYSYLESKDNAVNRIKVYTSGTNGKKKEKREIIKSYPMFSLAEIKG